MKAILRFDLTDEEDRREYEIMNKANDMLRVITEFKGILRSASKYGLDERITNREEAAEYFQEQFYDSLSEYKIPEEY